VTYFSFFGFRCATQPQRPGNPRDALALQYAATSMTQSPVLFLDFDGVLHPAGCPASHRFMHLPRFQKVMHEYPEVEIVLSVMQPQADRAHKLRALFSPLIRTRVLGDTLDTECEEQMRYRQILKFMRQHRRTAPWLALDDSQEEFPPRCPQLVLCEPGKGFDEETETHLRLKLLAIRALSSPA
jgi:hypothetical protein